MPDRMERELLTQRLESVERRVLVLQAVSITMIIVALLLAWQWLTRSEIVTPRLVLSVPGKSARAELHLQQVDEVRDVQEVLLHLALWSAMPGQGQPLGGLTLGPYRDSLALALHRKGGGIPPVYLGEVVDGSSGLYLHDTDGHVRARLSLTADGTPDLALLDRKGKIIWRAP